MPPSGAGGWKCSQREDADEMIPRAGRGGDCTLERSGRRSQLHVGALGAALTAALWSARDGAHNCTLERSAVA